MDRRKFLRVTGAASLAGMWSGSLAACAHSTAASSGASPAASRAAGGFSLAQVGLQLYTVRDAAAKDLDGTLAQVAAAGYKLVETAGLYDRTPADLRALFDKHGIRTVSGHYPLADLEKAPDAQFAAAKTLGQEYVTVPWLDPSLRTAETFGSLPGRLNKLGEQARAAGLKIAYHNHDFEFTRVGGSTLFDTLLARTDPALVDLEMDVYWVTKAGADPVALLRQHPRRFPMLHLKDATAAPERRMVDVGAGTIDWAALLTLARDQGTAHAFVEHDEPTDPLASIRASYSYLSRLTY